MPIPGRETRTAPFRPVRVRSPNDVSAVTVTRWPWGVNVPSRWTDCTCLVASETDVAKLDSFRLAPCEPEMSTALPQPATVIVETTATAPTRVLFRLIPPSYVGNVGG